MQAGKLNQRIELQSATVAADSYGEPIQTWTTYTTVWAAVAPLSGRELIYAQQVSSETNIRITIRYTSAVAVGHRVKYGTRYFDINAVIDRDMRNEQIELMCKEAV